MSHRLPEHIDPWRIAEGEENIAGVLGVAQMVRLAEGVLGADDEVSIEIRGLAAGGRAIIEGRATLVVSMTCQRCLEPVGIPIEAEFRLGLVEEEHGMAGLPADLDPMILRRSDTCSLPQLVEDELILALPIVPRHPKACAEEYSTRDRSTQVRRPFSELGELWARSREQEQ